MAQNSMNFIIWTLPEQKLHKKSVSEASLHFIWNFYGWHKIAYKTKEAGLCAISAKSFDHNNS